MVENDVSQLFNNTLCVCAKYFMACNTLKCGRDSVSCEDVVVGYTFALKLLTEDIREYVIKYYDGDKNDLKITTFENNDEMVQDSGIGFKGAVSIIFAILAFLEVILIIIYIKELIVPEMEFTNNPIIRLIALAISFYVAKKFYEYLTEGNDINLFENGKSKVMLIFIVIFVITIIVGFTM